MKLYVYDHCPFCVRARMIFGLKNIALELIQLANDDEKTPVELVGRKMVPILQKEDGTAMAESLDIVDYIDRQFGRKILSEEVRPALSDWMQKVGEYYNHLLLPRFIHLGLAEFETQSAVDYFVAKKQEYIGDFARNMADTQQYLHRLEQDLAELEPLILSDTAAQGKLSLEDIQLFPMLRNLTCVKGLVFPPKIARYTAAMAKLSAIDLYSEKAL
ncbi:glutaredoxin 2 [Mesocricetibacter intestinalis]|uniref:Glutaredoxin 2 n=1 Tax=Mesocricetibacter intestinalis TaxID=1521930 RepID=A0A4R6VEZ0_9PAST|nr:glutaredoxin 2 [Mesocricetibacter intestinalis]TDQ59070.1 glutaredoxin 2 [Mesocricetibacter intestinalis]